MFSSHRHRHQPGWTRFTKTSLPEELPDAEAEEIDDRLMLCRRKRRRHLVQRLFKYLVMITCSLAGILIFFAMALLLIYFLMVIFTSTPLS